MAKDKLIEAPKKSEVATVKPVEPKVEPKPVDKPIEQPKVLKFMNPGKAIKIKLIEGNKFRWITLKTGDEVELSRRIAKRNNLVEVK